MATQRITIAKVGGAAAEAILLRLREWAAMRQANDRSTWSSNQWPPEVRHQVDQFADLLRAESLAPPVIHFVEWADLWSMGDLFERWLTAPDGPPLAVFGDQFQVFGYGLPDGGWLSGQLANASQQQFAESEWFVGRLREAVEAWQGTIDRSAIVVLRQVIGASATDEEVLASLSLVPAWLAEQA